MMEVVLLSQLVYLKIGVFVYNIIYQYYILFVSVCVS